MFVGTSIMQIVYLLQRVQRVPYVTLITLSLSLASRPFSSLVPRQ